MRAPGGGRGDGPTAGAHGSRARKRAWAKARHGMAWARQGNGRRATHRASERARERLLSRVSSRHRGEGSKRLFQNVMMIIFCLCLSCRSLDAYATRLPGLACCCLSRAGVVLHHRIPGNQGKTPGPLASQHTQISKHHQAYQRTARPPCTRCPKKNREESIELANLPSLLISFSSPEPASQKKT